MAALAVVPGALAGNGKKPNHPAGCVSAVCVYTEPNPTGIGGSSYGSGGGGVSQKPMKLSKTVTKKVRHYHGKDKATIVTITRHPTFGTNRLPQSSALGPAVAPSPLGATFNAGSGLTVLISVLLGTAVLTAAFEAVRRLRRR